MEIKYQLNSRILLLAMVGVIMTCTSYLMYVYDPFQLIIKKVATLNPGSIFLKIWSDPPYEVLIEAYIFNVTNPDEFLAGKEKLRVNQIGPYAYQELLKNNNATFNDADGTMTFYPKRYLKFRRDLSVGDPDEQRIISTNIPLVGISASLQKASMLTNFAVSTISNMLGSKPFVNISVSEYLWGYDDRLVTLAHKAIPSWINFERFGIFERLMALDNASNIVTLSLHPELTPASPILKDYEKTSVNHIHRWNGSPGLAHWGYKEPINNETVEGNTRCNMLEGAFEGTAFPNHLQENATLKVYRRAFCRPVPFHYVGRGVTKEGFEGYRYKVDQLFLARPEENPDNSCYCVKGQCLKKGLGSISPCYYDIPIAISQPHFLNSDPSLLEQIDGMEPNDTLHNSEFILHPSLGIPLKAELRIQINLDVGETKYNSRTKPFNGLVLPLFWLQLKINEIPADVTLLLTVLYSVLPILNQVLIYLLGLGGLAIISGSALLMLFFPRHESNGRLSFRGEYSPIPIIPISSSYFKPDIRILK